MNLERLFSILRRRRPAWSADEESMIREHIDSHPLAWVDGYGNRHIMIGCDHAPRVMFTAHTDTVHHQDGRQLLGVDFTLERVYLADSESNCLGADDGAGVVVLLEMIEAGVPGWYVFFRDEERGGRGSAWLATSDVFKAYKNELDIVVSFDRQGYHSVITGQGMGTCCSDDFAEGLADQLGVGWDTDPTGVFTDSASLADDVSECTNVSVGYFHEHSKSEWLDYGFLRRLIARLIEVDWDSLPARRQPGDWGAQWWQNADLIQECRTKCEKPAEVEVCPYCRSHEVDVIGGTSDSYHYCYTCGEVWEYGNAY